MAAVDLVCGAILLAAGIRVAVRGFVAEVFSVGAVAAGLAAAFFGHPLAVRQLAEWWGAGWWNVVVASLVLFVAGYLVVKLVEAMFEGFFGSLRLKGLDRILGLAMGVAEGRSGTMAGAETTCTVSANVFGNSRISSVAPVPVTAASSSTVVSR